MGAPPVLQAIIKNKINNNEPPWIGSLLMHDIRARILAFDNQPTDFNIILPLTAMNLIRENNFWLDLVKSEKFDCC